MDSIGESNLRLMKPTIPSAFVWDALASCPLKGLDPLALLEEAGLQVSVLKIKGSRVSVRDYATLFKTIIKHTNDGFLGFTDDPVPLRSFSVYASSLPACGNFTEALTQANRFYALFTRQFHFDVSKNTDKVRIILNFQETQSIDYRFIYQSFLLLLLRLVHWLLGENITPCRVGFTFAGSNLNPYFEYLFNGPINYEQSENYIEFDKEVLESPFVTNLAQINTMLRDTERMMLISHRSVPFSDAVRKALILNRSKGWMSVRDVSESIGISENLLWRKLKKEGSSFLAIRDAVKRDLALTLVSKGGTSFVEIAERLFFADASSFNKAFKGWTGCTPTDYRRQLRQDNGSEGI